MIDVVQIHAADGERLQVVDCGGFLHFFAERRVIRREHPRDECREAAGVFLNLAQALQMIHAVAMLFAAAEHHCGRGAHA